MPYPERVELYRAIENHRERPLIVYCTSFRPNAGGQIGSDVVSEFAKQLIRIPKDVRAIDILIISPGGDPTVSWRIISMLRERFEVVGALLPHGAYSAATLLALGADEIVMHPFSNLGPVDPQLRREREVPGQPGQKEQFEFGSEDISNFMKFAQEDVGISDQEQLEKVFELICGDVGAIAIGTAKRGSQLALSMGEKLLSLHMKDENQARGIAEALNSSFYHHGYPVGRKEAKEINLPVTDPDEALEGLLWSTWVDIEAEMQCNVPLDLLQIVLQDPDARQKLAGPISQVSLPHNLPPQIMQQVVQQIIQNAQAVEMVNPVEFEIFNATLESIRCRSEFRTKGIINAMRLPDLNIKVHPVQTDQGWKFYENTENGEIVSGQEEV